ncbi:protein NRT1/ PTR FAMILY 2.7-like [Aristolochia californica]|uniref:protein NRT1/ PTR FAMILY 2.7-like n=1 Tax=Aristolochia californica TaxID=171875 RepID=UPI0035DC6908
MSCSESRQSPSLTDEDRVEELKLGRIKHGGWITFPFIAGNMMGLGFVFNGVNSNLIVYLIQQFSVKSIDATQIVNIVNGCTNLAPVAGAIIADSYFGCFTVVFIATTVSMLGMLLLILLATIRSLQPSSCQSGSNTRCESASATQFAVLYAALALLAIGVGGTRFNTATMGANQFHKAKDRNMYFNWFFFTMYIAFIAGSTVIVYVDDNVSWGWGYGICLVANAISLALFLTGRRYYRHVEAEGSPFTRLLCVVLAAVRKRKVTVPSGGEGYYQGDRKLAKSRYRQQTSSFSFFNRAATMVEGDIDETGSIAKPWRLCTVEQVEDLKALIRIFPVWSTSIFLSTPIAIQSNLTVLQALSMDRQLSPHFSVPAGSFTTIVLLASAIALAILDLFLYPSWQKLASHYPTPLQRVGLGHIVNILGMMGFAVVESRRLDVVHSHHLEVVPSSVAPMSAFWLVPPLILVGVGEALHFPGQVAMYYQEFPTALHSTASAMVALLIGIGFYLSAAITDLIRRLTAWLPNDINSGRLDNVYWMLAVLGAFNFGYFLLCAKLYKYQNAPKEETELSCSI